MAIINTGSQLPTQGQNSELSIQQDDTAQFLFKTGTGAAATTALTVSSTQATFSNAVTLSAAGTTSTAPIQATTGSLTTSPAIGNIEFVTGQFYATPYSSATAVRTIIPALQFYTGTNTLSSVTSSTGQSVFGKAVSLAVGSYLFEVCLYSQLTPPAAVNVQIGFEGTASGSLLARIAHITDSGTAFINTSTTAFTMGSMNAFNSYVTCTNVVTTSYTQNVVNITGSMSITSAGTIAPYFRAVSTTYSSIAVQAGSHFWIYPIQDNVGSWA